MPIDLSSLSENALNLNAVTNLVLVTPENKGYRAQNPTGLDEKILFNFELDNKANLESDITDYFVEDNTALQDQISLKPETITVRGLVGELNNVITGTAGEVARTARDRLLNIADFNPELTLTALRAYNLALQGYQLAANAKRNITSAANALRGDNTFTEQGEAEFSNFAQTEQQIYFRKFYTYWRNRTLFTIQTPWAVFKNMAIQRLTAIQDEESELVTDFEITFKVIRFSSTLQNSKQVDGRLTYQNQLKQPNGLTSGIPTATSVLEGFA